jgi:hypothetical protein
MVAKSRIATRDKKVHRARVIVLQNPLFLIIVLIGSVLNLPADPIDREISFFLTLGMPQNAFEDV